MLVAILDTLQASSLKGLQKPLEVGFITISISTDEETEAHRGLSDLPMSHVVSSRARIQTLVESLLFAFMQKHCLLQSMLVDELVNPAPTLGLWALGLSRSPSP